MIKQLCREMNISPRFTTEENADNVINRLTSMTTDREKRIIIIEAAGIIMADNDYSESEKEIITKISEAFGIENGEIEKIISTICDLYSIYTKFGNFLSGKTF